MPCLTFRLLSILHLPNCSCIDSKKWYNLTIECMNQHPTFKICQIKKITNPPQSTKSGRCSAAARSNCPCWSDKQGQFDQQGQFGPFINNWHGLWENQEQSMTASTLSRAWLWESCFLMWDTYISIVWERKFSDFWSFMNCYYYRAPQTVATHLTSKLQIVACLVGREKKNMFSKMYENVLSDRNEYKNPKELFDLNKFMFWWWSAIRNNKKKIKHNMALFNVCYFCRATICLRSCCTISRPIVKRILFIFSK